MRILYVSHSFPPPHRPLANIGGMQRIAVDLHRTLAARKGVRLTALSLETSWRMTGVRTGPFLLSLLRRIPRLVRRDRIEVVLFSSMVTAAALPFLQRRIAAAGAISAAIPVGRDLTLRNPLYQRYVPRVLRSLDLVFPISRATAKVAMDRGAAPDRVHIVPCGIDTGDFCARESKDAARARLVEYLRSRGSWVPAGALLLLSVGRHQERKGFHWFVDEVMPALPASARYLLAGSGPMTAEIRERVRHHGLDERVLVLGQVSEEVLRTLYRGSDLFVMPNIPVPDDMEGFGVVLLEAGMAGLPVVASELEGIRDVITPGANGRLVPPRDRAGFVREIVRYAEEEVRLAESATAARHVANTFGWDSVVDRYLGILAGRLGSEAEQPEAALEHGEEPAHDTRENP